MEYQIGNKKIGRDTAIVNMTSATDCPSKKLGFCKHCADCYAMKSERQYPQVLPCHRRQDAQYHTETAGQIADGVQGRKLKHLRYSMCGDFRGQRDVQKMSRVADRMAKRGISVYGYTARRDLDFSNVSDNMTVNGSGFMVHNNFYIVEKRFSRKRDRYRCAGDCRTCKLCKVRRGINIAAKKH